MAFKYRTRVRETSITTGTGDLSLAGAVDSTYQTFSSVMADGDTTDVRILLGSNWESCPVTFNSAAGTLTRGTPYESTNAGALVNFGAGTKDIIMELSANRANDFAKGVVPLRSYLAGLTLSTAGSSATFGIAAGQATDSTNAVTMVLDSAYTKTTSAWALGTAAGSLDTGTIANGTWYHVWLIRRSDTGVVDALISLSATAPTMPTNYNQKRRIGAMKTNGSAQWLSFVQYGDAFILAVTTSNSIAGALGGAPQTVTLTGVPTGVIIQAKLRCTAVFSSATTLVFYPIVNDGGGNSVIAETAVGNASDLHVFTNTSAQIAVNSNNGITSGTAWQYGWIDRRGRDD